MHVCVYIYIYKQIWRLKVRTISAALILVNCGVDRICCRSSIDGPSGLQSALSAPNNLTALFLVVCIHINRNINTTKNNTDNKTYKWQFFVC